MSDQDTRKYLILKDPNIYKGLITLAVPVMLNNFIKTVHDMIDMYFVSRITEYSAESVSAISITFPIVFMFISLGIGLSVAGTSIMSQLIGAGQEEDARKFGTNLLIIAVIVGAFLNVIGYFGAPIIMKLMGAEGYLLEKSTHYLQIRSFELIGVFIVFAFTSVRQSSGDTVTPVIFGVITMVLNSILSPIMISILGLGVEGAAYATVIGNTLILPFVVYLLFYSKNGITIKRKLSLEKEASSIIIKTAVPAAFGQSITAIGFAFMNIIIISYGAQTVAAFSVGNRISSLILHPVMAIGGILAAYIGQNIGAGNPERARESFHKGLTLSVGIMVTASFIMMFFRGQIAGIFLDQDPEALELATTYIFYLLIGLPLMAIFQSFIGAFNGNSKTNYTFIVSVTRLWLLRIPLILLFTWLTNLGSSGIWTAMLISNFVIAIIAYIFYTRLDFKPKASLDI
jgi:putative MATE family efflux protein